MSDAKSALLAELVRMSDLRAELEEMSGFRDRAVAEREHYAARVSELEARLADWGPVGGEGSEEQSEADDEFVELFRASARLWRDGREINEALEDYFERNSSHEEPEVEEPEPEVEDDPSSSRDLVYIYASTVEGLEQQVREMYMHGEYEPVGALAVDKQPVPHHGVTVTYIQLMVRK